MAANNFGLEQSLDELLRELRLVDAPPEGAFDKFTKLASMMLKTPVSLISVVEMDRNRQFFKSQIGLSEPWSTKRETPLSHSFCQHVTSRNASLIVEDAREHPLVSTNKAIQDLGVIAYLGAPIHLPDGRAVGALCAISPAPREWSEEDLTLLEQIADCASDQIALRIATYSRAITERRYQSIVETQEELICRFTPDLILTFVNDAYQRYFGRSDLIGRSFLVLVLDNAHQGIKENIAQVKLGSPQTYEHEVKQPDGSIRWQQWTDVAIGDDENEIVEFQSVGRDITERKQLERRIHRLAMTDNLVDLPNRKAFDQEFKRCWARARRAGQALALILIDIDHFKFINDNYGHQVGDAFLIEISSRMRLAARQTDFVARLSGDEFAVIAECPNDEATFAILIERILTSVRQELHIAPNPIHPSISIGVAIFPEDACDPTTLRGAADAALYAAKAAGRGTWRRYKIGMQGGGSDAATFTKRATDALKAQRFELDYQPLFNLQTNEVFGLEALLRWNDPDHGRLNAGAFIEELEQSPAIIEITAWTIDQACREFRSLRDQGLLQGKLWINIAGRCFGWQGFVGCVAKAIERHELRPEDLVLEITEFSFVEAVEAEDVVANFLLLGVGLAIDDFGTGFSSLARLMNMPVHYLKIDQSFLQSRRNGGRATSVIEGIAQICRSCSMVPTIEGIECEGDVAEALDKGCLYGQGYQLARPMPYAPLCDWLKNEMNRVEAGI